MSSPSESSQQPVAERPSLSEEALYEDLIELYDALKEALEKEGIACELLTKECCSNGPYLNASGAMGQFCLTFRISAEWRWDKEAHLMRAKFSEVFYTIDDPSWLDQRDDGNWGYGWREAVKQAVERRARGMAQTFGFIKPPVVDFTTAAAEAARRIRRQIDRLVKIRQNWEALRRELRDELFDPLSPEMEIGLSPEMRQRVNLWRMIAANSLYSNSSYEEGGTADLNRALKPYLNRIFLKDLGPDPWER